MARKLNALKGKSSGQAPTRVKLADQPPPQHADVWTCPKTGIEIPKTLEANVIWRRRLQEESSLDDTLKDQIYTACSQSWHFFANAFLWTFRQKVVADDGSEVPVFGDDANWPLVTWLVQDEFADLVIEGIEKGYDVDCDKSREMGASWIVLAVFFWWWLFRGNSTFLIASRVENEVDKRGDMDTLFEKCRYLLKWLPAWMKPRHRTPYMTLENLDNGSMMIGESTNADVGRGGRKTAALIDEAAAIRNLEAIDSSLSQTTACVIRVSTPHGPGTWFHKRLEMKLAKAVVVMPWWRHPEKCKGAHQVMTPEGKPKWTSLWYALKAATMSKKAVAQELDLDHGQAGDMFFDLSALTDHARRHKREPLTTGELLWFGDVGEEYKKKALRKLDHKAFKFTEHSGRERWRIYVPLENGRLPQQWTYCLAGDIALGSGASNSVLTVACKETGAIVAKFWDAFTPPEEFAEIAMMAGVWCGGAKTVGMLIWENNGPGSIFGNKIVKWKYRFFYRQRIDGSVKNTKTPRWGWNSNGVRKAKMLGEYRAALETDKIINPCGTAIDEAKDYIWSETGEVMPARLLSEKHGGRALHGDHVIADGLVWMGLGELPTQFDKMVRPPPGSYAARRDLRRKMDRRAKDDVLE